jgi:hypothetical protein
MFNRMPRADSTAVASESTGLGPNQISLRDGTIITVAPMDLEGFVTLKNLLMRLAEQVLANQPPDTPIAGESPSAGLNLIIKAFKLASAEDLLDLMEGLTGFHDREVLKKQFTLPAFVRAIQIALANESFNFGDFLGEARG